MELHSITCPNCGANTTNPFNCEYCGSFLVQKAHQGIDLTDYVQIATQYANPIVSQYTKDVVDKIKSNPKASSFFQIYRREDDSVRVFEVGSNNDYKKEGYKQLSDGISIWISPTEMGGVLDNKILKRLKNTPLYKLFDKVPCLAAGDKRPIEMIPEDEVMYVADFGFDAEGAALVVSQLLLDVFMMELDDVEVVTDKGTQCTLSGEPISNNSGCLGVLVLLLAPILGIAGYTISNILA